jgi:hypothetical protein
MKNSTIYLKIDLGPVLDQTRMESHEVAELLDIMDLNAMEATPLCHVLTDMDTGEVTSVQEFETGLIAVERYTAQ